jgi:hypothetical protein
VTDEQEQSRPEVGSVGEEAAKLLGALQDWARDNASRQGAAGASAAAGMAAGMTERLAEVNAHLATGGEDCTYCPVCQVIRAVRQTSPEVRAQLTTAASALLQAAAEIVEARTPRRPDPGVEKIDLD